MVRGRTVTAGVLLLALLMSHWATASPHGLGSEANHGCQCHGASTDTVIQLLGVPETFAANTTYEVTLQITSPLEPSENHSQGGFRLLVDEGSIELANSTTVQKLDGGWTHTTNGSDLRSWTFDWRSPDVNNTAATFLIYGNAVNGNNAPTGDAWTTLEVVVPGEAYTGPLTPDEGIDGVSSSDRVLLVVGLGLIAGLVWAVARP